MATQFQLVMRSGPTPGMVFPLEGDLVTIGRDATNTIAINDTEVSRKHATMIFQGGKYVIEDLGSTNGTAVNGQRISAPHVLKPGSTIAFGDQIALDFEAVTLDADATMASSRRAAASRRAVTPPPPPAQAYVGQVPRGPAAQPGKRSPALPIIIAAGVLILICACGSLLYWIDSTYRWCQFFPFIPGC